MKNMMTELPSMLRFATFVLACVASTGVASAQAASFTIFGPRCQPTIAPELPLSAVTLPRIGTTFTLRTDGSWQSFASSGTTLFLIGDSRTRWGALPLPFDMSALSSVGLRYYCTLQVAPSIVFALPVRQGARAPFDVQLPIPAQSSLVGVRVYQQSHMFLFGIGEVEAIASQGGEAVIGL